jgi:hypothetical protein
MRCFELATAVCFLLPGCYAQAGPGYADVTSAPVPVAPSVQIETYPSTTYEGRTVYLYQDRWYYRDGPRWSYYHDEPRPLYDHRMRRAPAAQPRRVEPEERHDRDDSARHERR